MPSDKQMNVVRHNHITPESNSSHLTFMSETDQRRMHRSIREKPLSLVRIERHKIQWRIVGLKYPLQPWRPVRHSWQRTL